MQLSLLRVAISYRRGSTPVSIVLRKSVRFCTTTTKTYLRTPCHKRYLQDLSCCVSTTKLKFTLKNQSTDWQGFIQGEWNWKIYVKPVPTECTQSEAKKAVAYSAVYKGNAVKFHFKVLGLYNFKRGLGLAYKRGAYIRVGL